MHAAGVHAPFAPARSTRRGRRTWLGAGRTAGLDSEQDRHAGGEAGRGGQRGGCWGSRPVPISISTDRQYYVGPGDTPDYFGMPNYANSPLPELVTTFTTFYFAEGTTRPGFDPYLCIQNPGAAVADVTITYMKGDGTTATQDVTSRPRTPA